MFLRIGERVKSLFYERLCLIELPTTLIAGFSGCSQLRHLLVANETLIQCPEVAKNYRAIPVVPTVQ